MSRQKVTMLAVVNLEWKQEIALLCIHKLIAQRVEVAINLLKEVSEESASKGPKASLLSSLSHSFKHNI